MHRHILEGRRNFLQFIGVDCLVKLVVGIHHKKLEGTAQQALRVKWFHTNEPGYITSTVHCFTSLHKTRRARLTAETCHETTKSDFLQHHPLMLDRMEMVTRVK